MIRRLCQVCSFADGILEVSVVHTAGFWVLNISHFNSSGFLRLFKFFNNCNFFLHCHYRSVLALRGGLVIGWGWCRFFDSAVWFSGGGSAVAVPPDTGLWCLVGLACRSRWVGIGPGGWSGGWDRVVGPRSWGWGWVVGPWSGLIRILLLVYRVLGFAFIGHFSLISIVSIHSVHNFLSTTIGQEHVILTAGHFVLAILLVSVIIARIIIFDLPFKAVLGRMFGILLAILAWLWARIRPWRRWGRGRSRWRILDVISAIAAAYNATCAIPGAPPVGIIEWRLPVEGLAVGKGGKGGNKGQRDEGLE